MASMHYEDTSSSESSGSDHESMDECQRSFIDQLEIKCECEFKTKRCPNTGLHNHWNFPPFSLLPEEDDVDLDYFFSNGNHKRNWWLIGEIVQHSDADRYYIQIRTRYGEQVNVFIYWNTMIMKYYTIDQIQQGHTFCILNPKIHNFYDSSQGIRIYDDVITMIFPTDITTLIKETDLLIQAKLFPKLCVICKEAQGYCCSVCKAMLYCGKDCQLNHWQNGHNNLCKHANMLKNLAALGDIVGNNDLDWSFQNFEKMNKNEEAKQPIKNVMVKVNGPGISYLNSNVTSECSQCKKVKNKGDFTNHQLEKAEPLRRCKLCIQGPKYITVVNPN